MNSSRPLISVEHVSQDFVAGDETIRPLKDVSFSIAQNSFNIVYGPSGSGKSTLLNILAGLQQPTKGTVIIEGRDMYQLNRDALANFRATQLGFVYQTNYWIKSLNVVDNVAMALYSRGLTRQAATKQAMQALSLVQMEAFYKKMPTMLSGGEQQRIAMARALVTDPAFIIADEPTGNLDSKNGDMVINLLQYCQAELNRTIVLVTHNMEYLPLADQLLHIEDGAVRQLKNDSVKEVTDVLFTDMQARIKQFAKVKHVG